MEVRKVPAAVAAFLLRRKPELLLFALGVALRMSMAWTYDATWSYDSQWHWEVVDWILKHRRVPTPDDVGQAQHPPLYYHLAAGLTALGVERATMVWVSILMGTLRLAMLWAGFELYLPRARVARLAALGLAAVLAASVHIDGMIYPEATSGMLLTAAMLLTPLVFRRTGWARWRMAGYLGLVLGLAMLTKISGIVVIGALCTTAGLEFLFSRDDWATRTRHLLCWAWMLAACVAVCGWYFSRNVRDYGRPFVTSFDVSSQHHLVADLQKVPYLERRSLGFFVSWDAAVPLFPYYPSGIEPRPSFFPVAVASTFVDYWNYSFSGLDPYVAVPGWPGERLRPITPRLFRASQYAASGGILIFLATVATWLAVMPRTFRRRDWGGVALLLVPLFTLVSAIHFAVAYPLDSYGVVKGVYMHFGAPPMYALFGLAVAWAFQKPIRWPLFGALLGALWLVASYAMLCRLRLLILPMG
jgi:4-amino-4-deoxy-L-arabinose transferase-like glycosyltransferase